MCTANLSIPPQRAIDLYRPQWDKDGKPVPPEQQEAHTSRINITFRFYRDGELHVPNRADGRLPLGARAAVQVRAAHVRSSSSLGSVADSRCLRADQRGKVRAAQGARAGLVHSRVNGRDIVDDGMAFFWQCQASRAGKVECGAFKVLDMKAEGRGPCMADPVDPVDPRSSEDSGPDEKPRTETHEDESTPAANAEDALVRAGEHVSDGPKQESAPAPVKDELSPENHLLD